ncbi:hypothetical protein SpCBS45565_g03661 [Spizellomyces sp. 'palustris']|nr:hypothetical protein SpCBS45565_g03661 [Spizellomyces sp. 'palustris']
MSFPFQPTERLYTSVAGGGESLGIWGPGNIAFPDLDDFASLLSGAASSTEAKGLPTPPLGENLELGGGRHSTVEDLEAFLLGSADIPTVPPSMGIANAFQETDFVFADVMASTGSSPQTTTMSATVEGQHSRPTIDTLPSTASRTRPGQPMSPVSITSNDEAPISEVEPKSIGKRRKLTAEEKDQRAKERAIRNRQAAQDSRDKKRKYIDDLQATNAHLSQQNVELTQRLESIERTNQSLTSRIEDLVSQLASFRKRFKSSDDSQFLSLGALSSDPAAVASQQRMLSSKRNSKSLATTAQGTSASKSSSTSTQAHPLATMVVVTLFQSMVYMITTSRVFSPLTSLLTLGSRLKNSAEGAVDLKSNRGESWRQIRTGVGLSPDLNGYYSTQPCSRLEKFPVLRKIWAM